jgi:CRISPR-associated protein Csb2
VSDPVPLVVSVELLSGRYEAGGAEDQQLAEWPPHPARLFCALVAAARGEKDRAVLAWLERQPPPSVHADRQAATLTRSAYVVTNTLSPGGSQTHPGRTNGRRARATAAPASPRIAFVWDAADAPAGAVEVLDRMARRVPYLGRSSGVALVSTSATSEAPPVPAVAFDPCDLTEAEVSLRVPYPGYLADLDALFEAGQSTWQAARFLGYRVRVATNEAAPPAAPSVYSDVVIFGFAGLRPDGRLAGRFTQALRTEVLRQAGDAAPAALHGHGADGRPHVAFLALPNAGSEHADGHLLGLAVAIPDLPDSERRATVAACLALRRPGEDVAELPVRDLGAVELTYRPGLVRPWGLRPERWRRGSKRWMTATPMVLDRYPKDGDMVTEVRRACLTVGLPEPAAVTVGRDPLLPGAVAMRPSDLPAKLKGRLYRHVSLTFDVAVAGPLLLGAGRYLGVGLFAPLRDERLPEAATEETAGAAAPGQVV